MLYQLLQMGPILNKLELYIFILYQLNDSPLNSIELEKDGNLYYHCEDMHPPFKQYKSYRKDRHIPYENNVI